MSKAEWLRHAGEVGYRELDQPARAEHVKGCRSCKARARTQRANRNARDRADAYRGLGLTKTPYGWE